MGAIQRVATVGLAVSVWADLKFEHKSLVRFVSISDLKSRNQKLNQLGRQCRRDRLAFEIRMGFHQLVAACAEMTGVALRQLYFMSDLKCEIKPAR
jgi:hypothetical protein